MREIRGRVTDGEDVNIGLAATVAANVCGLRVSNVAILAEQVDESGDTETVCTIRRGPVTIEQNQ